MLIDAARSAPSAVDDEDAADMIVARDSTAEAEMGSRPDAGPSWAAAPVSPEDRAAAPPLSRRERRALDERTDGASASPAPIVSAPFASAPFAAPPSTADESAVTPDPFEGGAGWAPIAATAAPPTVAPTAASPTSPVPASDAASVVLPTVDRPASAPSAAQLAEAAPPVAGTAAPADALAPGWPVLPQLAAPGSALDVASADYEPMARTYPSSAAAPPYLIRGSLPTGTVGAWGLALLPLVIGAAIAAVILLLVLPDPAVLLMTGAVLLALIGIGIGSLLWTILFAALDRRRLRTLGHDRRPSVLWAIFLGPFAYFLARIVALRDSGRRPAAPLVGYIVALVLVGVGAGVAVGAGAASLTAVSAISDLESSLETSLAQQGMTYEVLCPSGIDLVQGAVMTCEARDDIGVAALVEVTITDPAGEFAYRMV